jgi:uncharacterized protein YgbK (DUF1537 family)
MQQEALPAAPCPGLKIVVLDDDPTGSQTLHSCPLLLRWDPLSLRRGLAHPSPFLFLLANTRALDPEAARERVRQICRVLLPALAEAVRDGRIGRWLIVSRGDSTLRGHTPLELETIAAELALAADGSGADPAGPCPPVAASAGCDAFLLVPAFLPGGRTTRDGVHCLNGQPVHRTAFARDGLFGYSTSHLPDWLEEKSGGRIRAADVQRLCLADLDRAASDLEAGAGLDPLCRRLAELPAGSWVVVDAERPAQLAALGAAVRQLTGPDAARRWGRPRRLLFQSAASLLNGLVAIGPQPLDPAALAGLRRRGADGQALPGMVLVGSHVPLADRQLARLLADPGCGGVELAVSSLARVLEGGLQEQVPSLEAEWLERLEVQLAAGRTPVLFTSRGERRCRDQAERRRLGLVLAGVMARLAGRLAPRLGYLISKGGITSHTLLADGLNQAVVELQGQLLPGLSLLLAGCERLPVLTFPGNLGDDATLWQAWMRMQQPTLADPHPDAGGAMADVAAAAAVVNAVAPVVRPSSGDGPAAGVGV